MRAGVSACVLVALLLVAPECGAQSTRDSSSAARGTNTCRYAHDGECDEEAAGTGACSTNTDTYDCELQHSCQYAHDGECDEPGPSSWGRTSRCSAGTDSDDCCPPHAHTSASRLQCSCNANYHVDEGTQTCQPGSPSPAPVSRSRAECDRQCEELEDAEAIDLCHDDCAMRQASPLVISIIIVFLMGIMFFPCIVFGIAHTCCIRDQRKEGRQPVRQAWTICTSLFVTALLCTWFPTISIMWVVLPFCMVAPFCFDQCYEDIGEGTPGYRAEARRNVQREAARREQARVDSSPPTLTVQAVPIQATPVQTSPVVAQAVMASPTLNPLSVGSTRIAPGTMPSSAAASPLPASYSAEVGVAATFEVEEDFDGPDDGSSASVQVELPAQQPSNLGQFLVANQLGQYESQLRDLGAVDVPDLRELQEDDMVSIGMKPLEIKRMRRGLAAQNPSDV